MEGLSEFIAALALALSVGALLLGTSWLVRTLLASERELEEARIEESVAEVRSRVRAPDEQTSYFEGLVTQNLENLAKYYEVARSQATRSYIVAVTTAVFGFAVILIGILVAVIGGNTEIAVVATAAGIITEFVAAVFHWQYLRATEQLARYHDSLLAEQKVLLAFRAVELVDDTATQHEMYQELLRSLMALATPPTEVGQKER